MAKTLTVGPAMDDTLSASEHSSEAAATPAAPRDETAFSIDPFTGAPVAPKALVDKAHEAMAALERGEIDEAGYNAAVAGGAKP